MRPWRRVEYERLIETGFFNIRGKNLLCSQER